MRNAAVFAIALLLAACGSSDNAGPGAPSLDEKRALDDAAEVIPPDAATPAPAASGSAQ